MQDKLLLIGLLLAAISIIFYTPASAGGGVGSASNVKETCDDEICHVIMGKGSVFLPDTLIIRPDATVVWTNWDGFRHTVTSGSPDDIKIPLNSRLIENGKTYEFTFNQSGGYTGKFAYFCQVHPLMRGEIIVQGEPIPEFPQIMMVVAASVFASMIAVMRLRKNVFKIS